MQFFSHYMYTNLNFLNEKMPLWDKKNNKKNLKK